MRASLASCVTARDIATLGVASRTFLLFFTKCWIYFNILKMSFGFFWINYTLVSSVPVMVYLTLKNEFYHFLNFLHK